MITLDARTVYVWYAIPDAVTDRDLLRRYEALLCADERAQWERIRPAAVRHTYLVAHALVRVTLSRYANVEPRAWTFVRNEYGRPEIAGAHSSARLRFSLSHTTGAAACGVVLLVKLLVQNGSAGPLL